MTRREFFIAVASALGLSVARLERAVETSEALPIRDDYYVFALDFKAPGTKTFNLQRKAHLYRIEAHNYADDLARLYLQRSSGDNILQFPVGARNWLLWIASPEDPVVIPEGTELLATADQPSTVLLHYELQ